MPKKVRRRWQVDRKILLLVGDRQLRDFLLGLLGEADVTVVTHPPEVRTLVTAHRYGLVIVTNFGESPWEAIEVVPEERDWPALFLSGHWEPDLEAICAARRVPRLPVPLDVDTFLCAVSDALQGPERSLGRAPGPGPGGRIALVERLLAGEAVDRVSEESGVSAAELDAWQRVYLDHGRRGLEAPEGARKRVYLAATGGSPVEEELTRKVAVALERDGHSVEMSQSNVPADHLDGGLFALTAATRGLDSAECVVMLLSGIEPPAAAAWEFGYATAKAIPVIGLRPKSPARIVPFAAPLAYLLSRVCVSVEHLRAELAVPEDLDTPGNA